MKIFNSKQIAVFYLVLIFGFVFTPLFGVPWRAALAADEVQELTFAWDANTEKDLKGYRLYRSDQAGVYVYGKANAIATIPAGTETVEVKNIKPGYFVLTAFDKHGNESGPSDELESFAPVNPKNAVITVIVKIVQVTQ